MMVTGLSIPTCGRSNCAPSTPAKTSSNKTCGGASGQFCTIPSRNAASPQHTSAGEQSFIIATNSAGACLIVVPLYSRHAPAELVAMMKDCSPALVCCGDAALRDGIVQNWPDAPPQVLLDEVFAGVDGAQLERPQVGMDSPVTIIYTSGTSG